MQLSSVNSILRPASGSMTLLGAALLLAGCGGMVGGSTVHAASQDPADAAKMQFYKTSAEPVLRANCYRCHSGMSRRGGFQMDTRQALLQGGHDGAAVVPGKPAESLLIKLIRHEGPADDPMPMPPKSKLSDADIATITRWVQDGAVMDR